MQSDSRAAVTSDNENIKNKMEFELREMKNKAFESHGRYFPRIIHTGEVSTKEMFANISNNQSIKPSDLSAALAAIVDSFYFYLKDGKVLNIEGIGKFKLEVMAEGVDDPKDFDQRKHVKRYVCRFNPSSEHGVKELYQGIKLKKARKKS